MAKGENIYKRKDGRWEGRYPKGRKENGSLYYGYIYGDTYRSVKERLFERKTYYYLEQSSKVRPYTGTFTDWGNFWLREIKGKLIKVSTYTSYQNKFHVHLFPLLGKYKLEKITIYHISDLIGHLTKRLASSSVQLIFHLLKDCLETAKQKKYIAVNPCDNVILPAIQNKKVEAFSMEIQKQMIQISQKETKYLPVLLALESGLRIGEICGLKWADIDFTSSVLHVRRTVQRVSSQDKHKKTELIEGTPKTTKGFRTIPLTCTLRNTLLDIKKRNSSFSEYVVTTGKNKQVEPRTINYRFVQLKRQLGIEQGTFHALRHSFATRCITLGGNVAAVSAMLGHSSIKMTLDTYTSSFLEDQRSIVEKFTFK
ncbi:site-specific integrase [Enterococcus sp. BWT-B8]|uniref:tyrosine-type recombinase/integrase n=1 Tax=unclassified Enterococcus TaxID=2608891 RepID=UPI001E4017A1|nr:MULTISPECIES: site-specific integrase [unclassified Enterococcus]MCB5952932.1 site-specific integrase [Enterococcus sp. BWT-B8]MCB5953560.1 site-specific integrase [Enterococcus sp. CWB-B31]